MEISTTTRPGRMYKTVIPELPFDKNYHLFVCYIKENSNEVRAIVQNLESSGVKCCYHERDFTPGQTIMDNMHEGIEKSLGMLIVLSDEFVSSKYCQFEVKEALHLHITEGYTLIPIKIEPCNVPQELRHLSHIDSSEDDITTAHLRIINTIVSEEIRKEDKKRNGACMQFPLKKTSCGKLSFTRHKLEIGPDEKKTLWDSGFEVPDGLLNTAERVVNESGLVKHKHVYGNLNCILSILFVIFFAIIMLIFLTVLLLTSDESPSSTITPAGLVLAVSIPTLFVAWIILSCYIMCATGLRPTNVRLRTKVEQFKRQAQLKMNNSLWDKVSTNLGRNSKLFVFYHDNSLIVMKLNLKPCKDVFLRQLKKRSESEDTENDQELVDRTDTVFEMFLRNEIHLLNIKSVPNQSGGHHMETGAKCPCILIRERVFS